MDAGSRTVMLNRIKNMVSRPDMAAFNLSARVNRAGLFRRHARLSRAAGLDRLYFVMSLDCDLWEDVQCVETVHNRLRALGVTPVYAVTGELLARGADTFRNIHARGGEFMNHGYREHTYFDDAAGHYKSCFFYDTLSAEQIREDIQGGDRVIRDVLGVAPSGFRAPHFGTFQQPAQLRSLHAILRQMNYSFSSSSMPYLGLRHGAVYRVPGGVAEFPVSGMWSRPLSVLDTWNCFENPERTMSPEDYAAEGRAMARHFALHKLCGVFNYYADPCHIADQDIFFDTVAEFMRVAHNATYGKLLEVARL